MTSTYIVNPGFELSTGETGNIAGGKDATNSKDYTETGWKNTNTAAYSCSAIIAYGSGQLSGKPSPTTDNTNNTGNALGISVGWSGTVTYQSAENIKIGPGTYTLKVNAYNANTDKDKSNNPYTYFKSLFGFVTSDGTKYLSTKTSFTQSEWTEDAVTFTLNEETEGYIQLGGKAQDAGSGSNAKLLLDNITLTKIEPVIQDGTYYLYDSSSKTFLSRGANWGTEATTDKYGIPVTTKLTDGKYTLSPADWAETKYINGNADDGFYTDQGAYTFSAEKSGDGIILSDGTKYVTHVTGSLGQYFHKTTDKTEATVWTLMSVADRNALVNSYLQDNYASVATASGMTDTDADQFLSSVSQNYTEAKYGEIAPTDFAFTATADPRKSSASNSSPREVFQGEGHFDYTATGLTKGIYKVTIPALYRNGTNELCVSNHTDYAINSNAYITANGEQVRVKGWAEERVSDNNPNNVNEANAAFTSGKYANEVYCYVGDNGNLNISVNYPNYAKMGWGIFGTTTITQYIANTPDVYNTALTTAKDLIEKPMNIDVHKALQQAINTYSNVTSDYATAAKALNAASKNATASIDAYAKANSALEQMAKLVNETNVYTAEALNTYYTTPKAKYDNRSLTDDEANALENPYTITGWHARNTVDDLLMSAWTAQPENWTTYHLNTWSTEDTDNGFPVPFIEYWVADNSVLADNTLTATVTGLEANKLYKLSALVRVSVSTSKKAPATGITLDLNGDTDNAVNITGNQIGNTARYLDTYTVKGKADSNGEIKINFNINSTNVSWLAFQNLKYAEVTAKDLYKETLAQATTTLNDATYSNVTGEEKAALQTLIKATEPTDEDGYTTAISQLNNAVNAFTSAKASYDNYAEGHEAADQIAKALGLTVTAPTTAAEAASYFDNLNVAEYQEVSKTYNNDLTSKYDKAWTNNNFSTASGQHWDGTNKSYIDMWSGSAMTVTATKTITLPAGKWVIKAAGRSAANANISMTAGSTTIAFPNKGNQGYGIATDGTANFYSDATYANNGTGRGWEWRFIPLSLSEQQDITLTVTAQLSGNSWASFCDLSILADDETANSLIASADDYKALNEALTAAEQKTLGFDKDEYAPYNNVEALQAIETAKAIDAEAQNSKDAIKALTEKLGQWTANTEAVSIVYNGNYTTVEDGANYPKGWTRTNGWGQMQTDPVTAYYNQPGTLKYGDRTGYTMPLKANTLYKLTFQYASWEGGSNQGMTATVLNADNEGLTTKNFARNSKKWNEDNAFVTATAFFTTGAAGDYVLTLGNGGNTVITGVAITEEQSLPLDEEATTTPDALTSPVSVTYNRSFKQGWNSIVLPFATTPEELGADEAVTFARTEGSTIYFETVTALEANKPYMVHFAEAKTGVTFTANTVEPTTELTTEDSGNQFDFVGSYVANNAPAAGDYIVVTKGIQKAKGGNHMKAFRAYFKAQDEESAAKQMAISIDGNDVTGINAIDFNDALQGNKPAYNLAGQRVSKTYKGIVIRNGKKTINK